MSDLSVFEYGDGTLVVDSRLIAEELEIGHNDWFNNIVLSYQTLAEQAFGFLRFENVQTGRRGRPPRFALLTEDQATFYMTLSRNTPAVVRCKLKLVVAFAKAKAQLREKKIVDATLKVYLLDRPVNWNLRGRVFQEDFYKEVYRLNGWVFSPGKTTHPIRVAQITIDTVYKRLQPGVWEEMVKKNPRIDGKRKHCCHQFLSDNIGNPHLRSHLYAVTKLMRGCSSWQQFELYLDKFHPKSNEVQRDILFDLLMASPEEFERWHGLVS